MTVARVLPNVTGSTSTFDYLVPERTRCRRAVGDVVRVDLHGRRIGGWVLALDPPDAVDHVDDLKPIAKVTGRGPSPDVIELAEWAAVRWAGRRRHFLHGRLTGPGRAHRIPRATAPGAIVEPRSPASTRILEAGGGVLRLPPTSDPKPAIMSAAALGPVLVVVAVVDQAMLMAPATRRGRADRRGDARRLGVGGGRRRRRDRRARGGLGAVPGSGCGGRRRRARRGAAGGGLAHLARPRRPDRARPAGRSARCC